MGIERMVELIERRQTLAEWREMWMLAKDGLAELTRLREQRAELKEANDLHTLRLAIAEDRLVAADELARLLNQANSELDRMADSYIIELQQAILAALARYREMGGGDKR